MNFLWKLYLEEWFSKFSKHEQDNTKVTLLAYLYSRKLYTNHGNHHRIRVEARLSCACDGERRIIAYIIHVRSYTAGPPAVLQSISYKKTHNTDKPNPWERAFLTSPHPGESSVNVYFSYMLQSTSYSKRPKLGVSHIRYYVMCYTHWQKWILVRRVSLCWLHRGRMHALPNRSRGFVASLQSTTFAVLSSARPPQDPETAFNGVDVDRGVEVARGLRETGLVELCRRPRATAEAGGVGERRFWGTVLSRFGPPAAISAY